ncbi:MAG: queuosine precursor transporter, partial [Holosporaceae bacterium]|nr:queuosine precursor transporter [Holosporaceae bacterium]
MSILLLVKYFGKNGLFVYATTALIVSNIQVLKLTKYTLIESPVAMGTVVFSTIFAVDNILTEYFGVEDAKRCIWMSFAGYLFFVLVMKIAMLHPYAGYSECVNLHEEMKKIFSPSFSL